MSKKYLLVLLFHCGLITALYSQVNNKAVAVKIKSINYTVEKIAADKTLDKLVFTRPGMLDSLKEFKTYRAAIASVTAFYKNKTLQLLRVETGETGLKFNFLYCKTDYFFDNQGLIYVSEKYHNNSRMGSCGDIDIENRMYFENAILLKTQILETPFYCYRNAVQKDSILADMEKVLSFLKIKK